MLQHIFNVLSIESILLGVPLFGMLLLLATMRQEICFALAFPAYIFFMQLRHFFPVSNSAGAALFPLAAGMVAFFKSFRFRFGLCEKLLLALAVLMVVSLAYSPTPTYGRDKATLFCFMIVPIIILAPNVITNAKSLRTVVIIIIVTSVVYVLTSFILRMQYGGIEGRSSGLLDVTRAGQFLGLAAILSCAYVVYRHGIIKKAIFSAVLIMSLLLLFMSGTRGALMSFVLSLLFIYWFVHIDWLQRLITKSHITFGTIILGVVVVLCGGYFLKSALPEGVYQRFARIENFFGNFTPSKIENWRESRGRALNYFSAVAYFADHPLTGSGVGGYKIVLAMYGDKVKIYRDAAHDDKKAAYPHNVILEFACEQGILGLILFLWILYLNFRMLLRLRKVYGMDPRNGFMIMICAVMYFYGLCVAMTSLDIPRMMILWWGMGLLIAADKLYRDELRVPSKKRSPNCGAPCFVKNI